MLAAACSPPEAAYLPGELTLATSAHTAALSGSPVVVAVHDGGVFFQGKRTDEVAGFDTEGYWVVPRLDAALKERVSRIAQASASKRTWLLEFLLGPAPRQETRALLAVDGDVRYGVVKKVMSVLTSRGYHDLEFAVGDGRGRLQRIDLPQGRMQRAFATLVWDREERWVLYGPETPTRGQAPGAAWRGGASEHAEAIGFAKPRVADGPSDAPERLADALAAERVAAAGSIALVVPDDASFAEVVSKIDTCLDAGYSRLMLAGSPL